jgi:hypothetical protein
MQPKRSQRGDDLFMQLISNAYEDAIDLVGHGSPGSLVLLLLLYKLYERIVVREFLFWSRL